MRSRHHGRSGFPAIVLVALCGLFGAGCIDNSAAPEAPASPGAAECGGSSLFESVTFYNSTKVDNPWYSLLPGTQFVLEGTANRGGGNLLHRVVFTVTDLTKFVNGVRTVVLWDLDYNAGVLAEAELAFHAQDDDGNVWVLGEYPEEYEHGQFVGAPSTWIAGQASAEAGILVPANLRPRYHYLQGWAPEVRFLDCMRVLTKGETICVPDFSCYRNVIILDEWSPLEVASGHQRKYYAPGVGVIRVSAVDDPEAETLVLVSLVQLGAEALATARQEALKLEKRAYEVSDVYRLTLPAR